MGWDAFFTKNQGLKCMSWQFTAWQHLAIPALLQLQCHGAPKVLSDSPWSYHQKDVAITRGSHPSASRLHHQFLLDEMIDMIKLGYYTVLPYSAKWSLPSLWIAPASVVPQWSRQHSPIVDYCYSGINQFTVLIAPQQAMQFGHALQHINDSNVYANPRYGSVQMIKIDLKDGYYWVPLSTWGALKLAVALPTMTETNDTLIAIPLMLPNGLVRVATLFLYVHWNGGRCDQSTSSSVSSCTCVTAPTRTTGRLQPMSIGKHGHADGSVEHAIHAPATISSGTSRSLPQWFHQPSPDGS